MLMLRSAWVRPLLVQRAPSQAAASSKLDDTLECWGTTLGTAPTTPPSGKLSDFVFGDQHGCALRPDGTLTCWGDDTYGQQSAPESKYHQLTAGTWFTCALRDSDDSEACWGVIVR